jgi:1-acyl-sn-glycerol-3-phosphate acyltransferase
VVGSGRHIHMYPQGTVSTRLSKGRVGAVQVAAALGIPIVPVGINGAAAAFRGAANPVPRRGEVTIRFGDPYYLPAGALPPDFTPFDPAAEAAHRPALAALTGDLMERIAALVDEDSSWASGRVSDGKKGTHRFA